MEAANDSPLPEAVLDALNKAPRVAETILVNGRGRPYTRTSTSSHAIHGGFVKPQGRRTRLPDRGTNGTKSGGKSLFTLTIH
jgi:hypothetical protein